MAENKIGSGSILIVDDDKSVRYFLKKFLEDKGYKPVLEAETGEKALEILQTQGIKLVFLDVRLPGMSGVEVLRKIKELKKDIGVIMITAYLDEKAGQDAMKEGAFDYLIKPFDMAYLELALLTKLTLMKK